MSSTGYSKVQEAFPLCFSLGVYNFVVLFYRVELWREPSKSLGISIVGGRGMGSRLSNGEVMRGIFIKHVLEDSPAGKNGTLKPGDRIIEVTSSEPSVQNILPLSLSYRRVVILAFVLASGVCNTRHLLLFICPFVCL